MALVGRRVSLDTWQTRGRDRHVLPEAGDRCLEEGFAGMRRQRQLKVEWIAAKKKILPL